MLYSSGMPILYIIAFLSFFTSYWVDKFLCKSIISFLYSIVLRVYRTPPRYDTALATKTRKIIKYSIFLHFIFGFYMYSNSSIFTYNGDESFSFLKVVNDYIQSQSTIYLTQSNYLTVERIT